MNTLKINIDKISNREVRAIIKIIDREAKNLGIDFYLIGARAKDFWFESESIASGRYTLDIDFAVFVPDEDNFSNLKSILVKKHGLTASKEIPHRMNYKGMDIDLLPFGKIADSEYVSLGIKNTIISAVGFQEVYNQFAETEKKEGELKLASLPGLCLLKLIAWDDRPAEREKDIVDISIIIKYYLEFVQQELFEDHLDLINDDFEGTIAAARILGRHIGEIISLNDKLIARVFKILTKVGATIYESKLGIILSVQMNIHLNQAKQIIQELTNGIKDRTTLG